MPLSVHFDAVNLDATIDHGKWTCAESAQMVVLLDGFSKARLEMGTTYEPDTDMSSARAAAKKFGGTVTDTRKPHPEPPGAVY